MLVKALESYPSAPYDTYIGMYVPDPYIHMLNSAVGLLYSKIIPIVHINYSIMHGGVLMFLYKGKQIEKNTHQFVSTLRPYLT